METIQYIYSLKPFAIKLTKDINDADDLVQELCLKYLVKKEYFEGKQQTEQKAILAKALYNLFCDSKRRVTYTEDIEGVEIGKEVTLFEQLELKEVFQNIHNIDNPTHKEALLAFISGYSYKEIAAAHNTTTNAVGGYIRYAREHV